MTEARSLVVTPQAEHLDLDAVELDPHPDTGGRVFPDGEVYVQLEEAGDLDTATVVHSGAPDPNQGLMQLYGLLELLDSHDVDTEVFFTYFPYSMQDDEFFPGALNRARAVLEKLVDYYGVEHVYALDAHFSGCSWTDQFPFTSVDAYRLIADDLETGFRLVGPDAGALERFGVESYRKKRMGHSTVSVEGDLDLEGEDVLVLDDVIETGGTMSATYDRIKEEGANRVEAAAVHGVLQEGVEKVRSTFDRLHLTNSVQNRYSNVEVEPLIRERL